MLSALHRYPKYERSDIAREWGRRSQRVQAAKRMERGPDADTVRLRALHDARGTVLREGVTYKGDGRIVPWCVRRSVAGRVNQVDIVAEGRVWHTGSARSAGRLV